MDLDDEIEQAIENVKRKSGEEARGKPPRAGEPSPETDRRGGDADPSPGGEPGADPKD